MKKIITLALALVCATALIFGLSVAAGENKAYANTPGTTPTLGNTMFKVSKSGDALMLATPIKGYEDCYEVGYEITTSDSSEVEYRSKYTNKFYTSIDTEGRSWNPEDIFGDSYEGAGMIIWEIGYDPEITYTFKAYALVCEYDGDDPVKPAEEVKVSGKENKLSSEYILSFENGEEEIDDKTVTYGEAIGTLPAITAKTGYTGVWKIGSVTLDEDTTWQAYSDKTAVAVYTANTYTLSIGGQDLTVTYDSAIGEMPALPDDTSTRLYKGSWQIDGEDVDEDTVWNYTSDKSAVAPYRTLHDNSASFAADFFKTSASDYTLAASAVDEDLDIADVTGVYYNSEKLTCSTSGSSFVFGNAYVKDMPVGDYVIDVYTDDDVYRVKVAVATMAITSVADLNVIGANDTSRNNYATAYLIVTNDIDGAAQANVNALSVWCGDQNTGFRGIFDGRGHVLKNLKLTDGYLFWGLGKATLRDFALIDPVQVATSDYVLASGVHHATIENVIIKAGSKWAMRGNYNHTTITDSVIVLENGEAVVGQKDDMNGNTGSSASNVAIAIGKKGSGAYAGLYSTAYEVGSTTYAEYKELNDISEYTSLNSMLSSLTSSSFDGWSDYLSFSDGSIYFGGNRAVTPKIALTSASNEIYAGNSMTFTATDAELELTASISGVTFNAATGELCVDGSVSAGTSITIRATSTIDTGVYEEKTITVEFEPVDLTSDGLKDIELGQSISVANVSGNVLAIKTATGSKVTLATANKVTASELNSAAGVNYSENLAITLYTSNAAYSVNAAFSTKIIKTVADLKEMAAFGASNRNAHTGYYVLGNDIDGTGQDSVNALSYDSTTPSNYTTAGFRGILDGRGHILKNLRLQEGMLFWGLGKGCVVKNIALIDPVQVSARGYCFARDIMGATVTNVVIKSGATSAFMVTGCSGCNATVTKCVVILPSGQFAINTAGQWGDRQTSISDLAIVVGNPTAGTLGNGAESFAGLIGTHYVAGSYATFKTNNNINEYTSSSAMLTALASNNYISAWSSPYISYADSHLKFNGTTIV